MSIRITDEDGNPIDEWPDRKDLVDLLCEQIIEKLADSEDELFKAAFANVHILPEITVFDPSIGSGGEQIGGTIKIGRKSVWGERYADGDIMGTLFHEYLHYLNYIYKFRPFRYENEEEIMVFSEVTSIGEMLQDNNAFKDRAYNLFIVDMLNTPQYDKYINYPHSYTELNEEQKKEVENYITRNNLQPQILPIRFQYSPSNFFKEEISAHTKTLEAQKMGMFTMSSEKNEFYEKELIRYNTNYERALFVEERDGYTPEGYKK